MKQAEIFLVFIIIILSGISLFSESSHINIDVRVKEGRHAPGWESLMFEDLLSEKNLDFSDEDSLDFEKSDIDNIPSDESMTKKIKKRKKKQTVSVKKSFRESAVKKQRQKNPRVYDDKNEIPNYSRYERVPENENRDKIQDVETEAPKTHESKKKLLDIESSSDYDRYEKIEKDSEKYEEEPSNKESDMRKEETLENIEEKHKERRKKREKMKKTRRNSKF